LFVACVLLASRGKKGAELFSLPMLSRVDKRAAAGVHQFG
jgi:hypothetical protein